MGIKDLLKEVERFQVILEVRATTNLKVPDAMIIASAAVNSCPVVGNDLECARKTLMIPYIYLGKYFEP